MPRRPRVDIVVVDKSVLAQNMYRLLFAPSDRFLVSYENSLPDRLKKSQRMRPDVLIINSNALSRDTGDGLKFPCPTVLLYASDRLDLKEVFAGQKNVVLIPKPFYPYDLLTVLNRLTRQEQDKKARKRKKQSSSRKGS